MVTTEPGGTTGDSEWPAGLGPDVGWIVVGEESSAASEPLRHLIDRVDAPAAAVTADMPDTARRPDAWLPRSAPARELRQVARLVAEAAALRRALRRRDDRAAQLAERAQRASIDPLTGLRNRRGWDEAWPGWFQRAAAAGDLVLAYFDLDRFKRVNDEQGHLMGDAVLRAAGAALQRAVRGGDLVARWGGDEFVVALAATDAAAGAAVVERLRLDVRNELHDAGLAEVTASAGWCHVPADVVRRAAAPPCPAPHASLHASLPPHGAGTVVDQWLAAADGALLEAKRSGRDRAVQAACQDRAPRETPAKHRFDS